eukprot:224764_1
MIKSIITSLFSIYALTLSNRRLLQTVHVPTDRPAVTQPGIPSLNTAQYSTVMHCTLPNTDPKGCAGRITSFENAGTNFKLTCSNTGACASATLNFTYVNSMVPRVEQISFSEAFAGYGATVIMDSTQSTTIKQYIDKFECKAWGACKNTNVYLIGGASLNDMDCPQPNFCKNCKVYVCEWGANGERLCGTGKECFIYSCLYIFFVVFFNLKCV